MSSSSYYHDPSQQGAYNYQGGQPGQSHTPVADANQSQDRANPYGYPESNTPQPYYGQGDYAQSHAYGQQQYPPYDYSNQQYGQHEPQSYNYQQQQYPPAGYDNSYSQAQYNAYPGEPPAYEQHSTYQQPPSHDPYIQQPPRGDSYGYDNKHQRGYDAYAQPGSPPDPAITAAKIDPSNPNSQFPPGAETDRGLMGALAGGAVGAYGGHQMGHGIIGGIGGAIAGSKLEDHYKDKKKKEKKEKRYGDKEERRRHREEKRAGRHERRRSRRGSKSSSSSSSSSSSDSDSDGGKRKKHSRKYGAAAGMGMTGAGLYGAQQSGRDMGHVHHGGYAGNFSVTSSNVTLDRDYDLIALCKIRGGKEKLSSIDLNDCLTNQWGQLKWARGGNAFASAKNVRLVDDGRVVEAELGDGRGGWSRSRIVLDERIGNEDGELVFVG